MGTVAETGRRALKGIGLDRAILFVLLGAAWSSVAGILSIYLLVRTLSKEEQGLYYTFSSLVAMQNIFSLGLTVVLAQFAAHEMAGLSSVERGRVEGSAEAKRRLYSLFWMGVRWYSVIAALSAGTLLIAGRWLFSGAEQGIQWMAPWVCLCGLTGLSLFLSPFLAIYEGQGNVRQLAQARLTVGIVGSICVWVAFAAGLKLWAAVVPQLVVFLALATWYGRVNLEFVAEAPRYRHLSGLSWRADVWPLQWRIALSWLTGYFRFNLFNPLLFRYQGASTAGRVGLTLVAAGLIAQAAYAWIQTKVPIFARLVAERRFDEMDSLFQRALRTSLALLLLAYLLLITAFGIAMRLQLPFLERVVGIDVFAMIAATNVLNHVVFALAAYLRSFKREPLLMLSIVTAIGATVGVVMTARHLDVRGVFLVNLLITFISFCWGLRIYWLRRTEYQREATASL